MEPLHCKPVASSGLLFTLPFLEDQLIIRSLDLKADMPMIHHWVNQPYAKTFWQMQGSLEELKETYQKLIDNLHGHAYILEYAGSPVAQIDLYQVLADELKDHVEATDKDCGLHLLLCPPDRSFKGLALGVLKTFMQYYFSFPVSQNLFAEPDQQNIHANRLAMNAGFTFLKTAKLSYKTANIYFAVKP